MNHGQCFPDKTILTVTFASMETRQDTTWLSIKFYTIDERMEEAKSRGKCWRGWKKFGGHCYLFSTETKNWTDAEVGITFNLTSYQLIDEPTYITEHSSSTLDLLIVNDHRNIVFSEVGAPLLNQTCYHLPIIGFLYHCIEHSTIIRHKNCPIR